MFLGRCYGMSGTDCAYALTQRPLLRTAAGCYAVSGTEAGYAATRALRHVRCTCARSTLSGTEAGAVDQTRAPHVLPLPPHAQPGRPPSTEDPQTRDPKILDPKILDPFTP
eukprot:2036195-Rhodomonas_salina.1